MHSIQRKRFSSLLFAIIIINAIVQTAASQSNQGLVDLLQRRLPAHADAFEFQLRGNHTLGVTNDEYVVSQRLAGRILVEGNSLSALASGYFTDVLHVDIWWYIGSRIHLAPEEFPCLNSTLRGLTIVPWRYHFNTVTFSYTAAFWTWEDWELQLDWMSLHGINLSLAWVGYEKTLLSTLLNIGLTTSEILPFFSGPAFQAWNRFGNIQRSWGGNLPLSWIEDQHLLQKKIVKRMVELGITPVLPAFTGFVPEALRRVAPNANIINGSGHWAEIFPIEYSNDSFLYPTDPLFTTLQHTFLNLQSEYHGNVTHIYTLDQYNENNPASGDLSYLAHVSRGTYQSLQSFDSNVIWMLQGWLFYASSSFWTQDRIEAYLGGVPNNESMLILDLFSESFPQWENTHQYYGKPWIWCQVHGYGGTLGLYGQIYNITNSSIEAFQASEKMVGMGNTMEGQAGNGLMCELLLDQVWDANPIDTEEYFRSWVEKRYHLVGTDRQIPGEIYEAWDILRGTAYNNTNLTLADSVPKSLLEMQPNITEFHGRSGQSLTMDLYDPRDLFRAWKLLFDASALAPELWEDEGWKFDMVDVTRQVLAERFKSVYVGLVEKYADGRSSEGNGEMLIGILRSLDRVLCTSPYFRLDTWVNSAVSSLSVSCSTDPSSSVSSTTCSLSNFNLTRTQRFLAYNAINQITIWGPTGQIEDYASKSWAGLVGGYYLPRWEMFLGYIGEVGIAEYNATEIQGRLMVFEEEWQWKGGVVGDQHGTEAQMVAQIEAMKNEEQRPTVSNITTSHQIPPEAMENAEISQPALVASGKVELQTLLHESANTQNKIDLPQEILRNICSYVDRDDLPNLRLVSHAYSHAAAVHMFRTVKFSFTPDSFGRFLNIAQSIKLRHYVLKLIYEARLVATYPSPLGGCLSPDCVELHLSRQHRLDEALRKLTNLKTVQFYSILLDVEYMPKGPRSIAFDSLWSFFTSSLCNVSKLRSIISANITNSRNENLKKLSDEESEALGRLYRLSLSLNHYSAIQIPTIMSCTTNLRFLELTDMCAEKDFSEMINPSTKFHSLVSLKLYGFNLHERYFKQFLLTNASSLRSLSLGNMKLEITEEEYTSESYLASNQWIRMFYFFGESMHLEEIKFDGRFSTSISGTWYAHEVSEGEPSSLMVSLKQFITHVEGSSFPLPHPDVDLTTVDLKEYSSMLDFFWYRSKETRGTIRLLEKKPYQLAVFKGLLEWGEQDSDIDSDDFDDAEDTESDGDLHIEGYGYGSDDLSDTGDPHEESDFDSAQPESHDSLQSSENQAGSQFYEIEPFEDPLVRFGGSEAGNTAFEQLKDLFLAKKNSWTEDEKKELIRMMNHGQTNAEGEGSGLDTTEEETPVNIASAE
ncbi:hypothetical protein DSL72_001910 [Monilinia vaccinii-corymbosi]|uniref:F-box domain-containing protein n=1 Tax=Monilinia vaccinii-corymbosi TaxID=61207 RepID=A0A8A3PB51_9HELO|nr:hypothetical protein DSL72_001910 [Monilinia vaccinii-corymbosi]